MEKEKFVKFVEKFFLNGKIPSAIIEIENDKIKTIARTPEGELRCNIEGENFEISDCKIGCYSTGTLLKMLSILDNKINLSIKTNAEKIITNLGFSDAKGRKINFAASLLDIIDYDGKKGNVKVYDVVIPLNQEVIDDILKSGAALSSETITFLKNEKDELFYCIFNYSSTNDDSIELELVGEDLNEDFKPISFSFPILKEIFTINGKRFNEAFIKISMKGLMELSFKDNDTTAEYWLVKLQD